MNHTNVPPNEKVNGPGPVHLTQRMKPKADLTQPESPPLPGPAGSAYRPGLRNGIVRRIVDMLKRGPMDDERIAVELGYPLWRMQSILNALAGRSRITKTTRPYEKPANYCLPNDRGQARRGEPRR